LSDVGISKGIGDEGGDYRQQQGMSFGEKLLCVRGARVAKLD